MAVKDDAGFQAVGRTTVRAMCRLAVRDIKIDAGMHAPQWRFRPRTEDGKVVAIDFDGGVLGDVRVCLCCAHV